MKRVLSGVIAGAFVATVGLAAQAPQAPTSPAAPPAPSTQAPDSPSPTGTSGQRDQTRAPGSLSQAAGIVTISGCIENAPASAAAAPGAPGAAGAAKEEKFVLANAKASAGTSASSSPGAPGGAVGTSGSASRYELDGQSAELTKHLNHQVEITGTVQPASAGAAAGAAPAAPKLMVSSVKMVAATCTK
jgi:hypothetical protein